MAKWQEWHTIENVYDNVDILGKAGVYEIRMVNANSDPIQIPRIGSIDSKGIVYIGKSVRLRPRIEGFLTGRHSGGSRYRLVCRRLKKREEYKKHILQYRVMPTPREEIDVKEAELLHRYIMKFCELPPLNSIASGRKQYL